jgi:uncharacterized membrane protein
MHAPQWIDLIFAIKFVHVLAAAAMFGTWLGLVLFMALAHHSGNTAVVALTARFAVSVEVRVMVAAIALQPVSGLALAWAIGVGPLAEFWLRASLALYGAVAVAWLAALLIEIRIRNLTQKAAIEKQPLPRAYRFLYRLYTVFAWPALAATVVLYVLMVWQPRMG